MRKGPIFKTLEMLRRKTKSLAEIRYVPHTIPMLRFAVFLYPPAPPPSPHLISIDRAKLTTQFAEPLNYQIIYKFTCLHLEFFFRVGGGRKRSPCIIKCEDS